MNAEWQLLRKTKNFFFLNENQGHQIASFAKEGCPLVLSPDKKDRYQVESFVIEVKMWSDSPHLPLEFWMLNSRDFFLYEKS